MLALANTANKQKKTNALNLMADVNIRSQTAAVHDPPSPSLQLFLVSCWLVNE